MEFCQMSSTNNQDAMISTMLHQYHQVYCVYCILSLHMTGHFTESNMAWDFIRVIFHCGFVISFPLCHLAYFYGTHIRKHYP